MDEPAHKTGIAVPRLLSMIGVFAYRTIAGSEGATEVSACPSAAFDLMIGSTMVCSAAIAWFACMWP